MSRPAVDAFWIAAGAFARPLVRTKLVVQVKYLTWADDGLLRQVVDEWICEDKPACEVVYG